MERLGTIIDRLLPKIAKAMETYPMRPKENPDGTWSVVDDDGAVLSTGHTMSSAWAWIDKHDPEEIAMEETRRRVSYFTGQR